jgi:hypothetical protein
MSSRIASTAIAALMTTMSHAAEEHFDLRKELTSDYLKGWLGTEVSLHIASDQTPAYVEVGRAEIYTARSFSPSPFGGGRRHCLDAFQKAVKSLVDTATAYGYDAVVNIRPVHESGNSAEVATFKCTPGYKITSVSISGSLAMSAAAKKRELEAESLSLTLPSRKAADDAIFLPADPILASPEVKSILASSATLYWGVKAPAITYRYGPDDYSDEAPITAAGPEAACSVATTKVLRKIVEEAKSRNFDIIIKVRSHLYEEYSPTITDVECLVGKSSVYVTLQATLAQR